ncbi:hypothetical protein E2C01_046704 [Portunus trituberculatus]|uniref:Uncharacterized protein n=1 Tax=Portunus trituberculatus TaxID=210409 RepID=A0A5B7G5V4_PORTR|nr:hypothetical protein [Portunus trituberculatus]
MTEMNWQRLTQGLEEVSWGLQAVLDFLKPPSARASAARSREKAGLVRARLGVVGQGGAVIPILAAETRDGLRISDQHPSEATTARLEVN